MELQYIVTLLLVTSVLGSNPVGFRRGHRRMLKSLMDANGYGIAGGKLSDIKKHPYTASLTHRKFNFLLGSGTILNKHWILGSAYDLRCVYPLHVSIRVGSNNSSYGGQELNISNIFVHDKFHLDYAYDVAVIKTVTPIKLGELVKPIKLATSTPKAGTEAQVVGYGSTTVQISYGSPVGHLLQEATVKVINDTECHEQYPNLDDSCYCADAQDAGPCSDDVGDPLVQNNQLVGYYLGGDICNVYGVFDIYANVATVREWILKKIKQHSNEDEMEGIDDDDFYRAFENY